MGHGFFVATGRSGKYRQTGCYTPISPPLPTVSEEMNRPDSDTRFDEE